MLPTPSACKAPSEAGPSSDLTMCSVMRAVDIVGGRDVVERFDDGRGGIVERFDDERYVVERFGDARRCVVERFDDGRGSIVERFGDARCFV